MPDHPHTSVDVNPARLATDPLLAQVADMVAYMDLHIGRHQIKQMTTEQKELWADLVDAAEIREATSDPHYGAPRRVVRWWRDYRRPIGEEGHAHDEQAVCRGCGKEITWDADIENFWIPYKYGNPPAGTFHCPGGERHWALPSGADEPDPFVYTDEGGTRIRGADQPHHVDEAAAQVARHALLEVADHTHPHWLKRHEDFAAVYEWAKQAVRPVRRTDGVIGSLRVYPSPREAEEFLTALRNNRT